MRWPPGWPPPAPAAPGRSRTQRHGLVELQIDRPGGWPSSSAQREAPPRGCTGARAGCSSAGLEAAEVEQVLDRAARAGRRTRRGGLEQLGAVLLGAEPGSRQPVDRGAHRRQAGCAGRARPPRSRPRYWWPRRPPASAARSSRARSRRYSTTSAGLHGEGLQHPLVGGAQPVSAQAQHVRRRRPRTRAVTRSGAPARLVAVGCRHLHAASSRASRDDRRPAPKISRTRLAASAPAVS